MLAYLHERPLLYSLVLVIILILVLKLCNHIFSFYVKKTKRGSAIHANFLKAILKAFLIVAVVLQIGSQFSAVKEFYSSILMSSSLLIVVLGFILQEGLSNIVHGLIISLFKPFELGDRVKVTVDGIEITGYVESITLRNTVIKNVVNSARVIVPNAKMDLGIVENSYFSDTAESSNFIDICVTYESDITLACQIMSEEICNHPLYSKKDSSKTPSELAPVLARELNERGVALRVFMITKTIEENFTACSDVRKSIAKRIQDTPGVAFAYTRLQMK